MEEAEWLKKIKVVYYKYLWWPWQIILVLFAVFFLYIGIQLLIHAYRLKDPFDFIMCFFSSNLIIMISVVLMIGFGYRMIRVYRIVQGKPDKSFTDINNP